jgi:hypothetical protein
LKKKKILTEKVSEEEKKGIHIPGTINPTAMVSLPEATP